MMIRWITLVALGLVATPLAAQRRDGMFSLDEARRLLPESCAYADSTVGRPLARPRERAYGYRQGDVVIVMSNDPFAITGKRPIDGIILNAVVRDDRPRTTAPYTFQLRLRDTLVRSGAHAALTLILDDSLEATLGSMTASTTPYSTSARIDQMLTISMPQPVLRRLVGATAVRGRIGSTDFEFPPKTLDSFRSVYLATVCGARL